jgi:Cu-Zn family superoxide dismutase
MHIMKSLIPALAATVVLSVTAAASPAEAGTAAEVTHGRFQTTTTGVERGFDITGRAVMVRSDSGGGRTLVVSVARGLEPGTTYGSHVHNAPCSTGGGGHYQHVVGGAVDDLNEIWPVLQAKTSGVAHGMAVHGHRARPEAQSIVIHDPSDGARIACLDLG